MRRFASKIAEKNAEKKLAPSRRKFLKTIFYNFRRGKIFRRKILEKMLKTPLFSNFSCLKKTLVPRSSFAPISDQPESNSGHRAVFFLSNHRITTYVMA